MDSTSLIASGTREQLAAFGWYRDTIPASVHELNAEVGDGTPCPWHLRRWEVKRLLGTIRYHAYYAQLGAGWAREPLGKAKERLLRLAEKHPDEMDLVPNDVLFRLGVREVPPSRGGGNGRPPSGTTSPLKGERSSPPEMVEGVVEGGRRIRGVRWEDLRRHFPVGDAAATSAAAIAAGYTRKRTNRGNLWVPPPSGPRLLP